MGGGAVMRVVEMEGVVMGGVVIRDVVIGVTVDMVSNFVVGKLLGTGLRRAKTVFES